MTPPIRPEPDPIQRRLQALQAATRATGVSGQDELDPIQRRLRALESTQEAAPRDTRNLLGKFVSGVERVGTFLDNLRRLILLVPDAATVGTKDSMARQTLALAGLVEQGVLKPAGALLQLPSLLIPGDLELTDKAADFVLRVGRGLTTDAEQRALDAGMSLDDVKDSYTVGGFIGFTAPLAASIKVAHVGLHGLGVLQSVGRGTKAVSILRGNIAQALKVAPTLKSHIAAGDLATDFVAGAVYGGLFTPSEEGKERLKHMAEDSALFGLTRIVLSGVIPTFRVWRRRRTIEREAEERFLKILDDAENGRGVVLTPDDGAVALETLNEENYLIHSPAAQDLLQTSAYDNALVQAIKDMAETRGSAAIFKASVSGETAGDMLVRFQKQFPGLKFERIKRAENDWDIYFGTRGLNNKQRSQLKVEGRFEGQILQHGGGEVIYVGKGKKPGFLKVKNADGKVFRVKEENITNTPFIREPFEFVPEWDALYRNFETWINDKATRVAQERSGILEQDLIGAIKAGRIRLPEEGRRAFDVGGAIVHPEEVGLGGQSSIMRVEFSQSPGATSGLDLTDQIVFATRGIGGRPRPATGKEWRINVIDARTGEPAIHFDYPSFEEMIQLAQSDLGLEIARVVKSYPTGSEVSALISQEGLKAANLLEPPPVISFERAFDLWARERGLPKEAVDYVPARHAFGDRYRRAQWEKVPAEDRALYDGLRAEQEELLAETTMPLERFAALKGFNVEKLQGGAVRIREVQTGMSTQFGTAQLARDALKRIVRPERDLPGLITGSFDGLHTLGGGYPAQDLMVFSEVKNLHGADLPFKTFRNNRDWTRAVERQTGIPIWSQGMDKIDQGYSAFISEYMPEAKNIEHLWAGIKQQRKYEIVDFWVEQVEALGFDIPSTIKAMRGAGFNAKEIRALTGSRALFDSWFSLSGISPERYIQGYYTRVRPFVERYGTLDARRAFMDQALPPGELEFWARFSRDGEMAMVEKDPELVMHKYIRTLLWEKRVKPAWDNLAILTGTRKSPPLKIRDLPPGDQQRVLSAAPPGTTPDSPVLPREVRDLLSEYLTVIRGMPGASQQEARNFMTKLLAKVNVKADSAVINEFVDMGLSTLYGAAMGIKLMQVLRNMTQTIWLNYTRFGGRHLSRSLEVAMTQEGFNEVVKEGAIALREASGVLAELNLRRIQEATVEGVGGPFSLAMAATIRRGLRVGGVSREFARRTLVPYSTSDEASRAWSYFATKFHVEEHLGKFEKGQLTWEQFEEASMAGFDKTIRDRFRATYDVQGKEPALRFVSRMGSDETNFIYGRGSQPLWMQNPLLRPFGMFGSWPMWGAEMYLSRIKFMTPGQQAGFIARNAVLGMGFANLAIQTGVNMWSWIAPTSVFGFGGGPAIEHVVNLREIQNAPIDRKASAIRRMVDDGLRLSFPGQAFVRDVDLMLEEPDPKNGILRILLGAKKIDAGPYAINWTYDPAADPLEDFTSEETKAIMIPTWLADPTTTFHVGDPTHPDALRFRDAQRMGFRALKP